MSCVSVCLSVCLFSGVFYEVHACPNFTKFSVHNAWPWLGLSQEALQHVLYFRFCGLRQVIE